MLSLKRPCVWPVIGLTASLLYLLTYVVYAKAETTSGILNLDQKAHTVSIKEGDNVREFSVAPNEELTNICNSECWLAIDRQEEGYDIAAFDRLVIEHGQLFYQDFEEAVVVQKEESEEVPEPAPAPKPEEGEPK